MIWWYIGILAASVGLNAVLYWLNSQHAKKVGKLEQENGELEELIDVITQAHEEDIDNRYINTDDKRLRQQTRFSR